MKLDLEGDRVRLRTATIADQAAHVAIRSTPEVRARWRGDDLDAEFIADLDDEETTQLTIIDQAHNDLPNYGIVGLIQFFEETDPEYRHASIDIYIDPGRHRQGIATDAISTLVAHLFGTADHHRVTIDPTADNTAAINCYAKVGFTPVGIMREYEQQADGTWADGLLMELLRSDWRN